jgi:hypothetical protein
MEVVDNLHPKCHPKLPSNKCEFFIILNMKNMDEKLEGKIG